MSRAGRLLESARMRGRRTVRIGSDRPGVPLPARASSAPHGPGDCSRSGDPPLSTPPGDATCLGPARGPSARPARYGPGSSVPGSARARVQVRGPCIEPRARRVPQPLPRAVGAAVPNPFVPDDSPSLRGSRRTPRCRQHYHPPPQPLKAGAGLLGKQRLAQHSSGQGTGCQIPGRMGMPRPSAVRAALRVPASPRLVPAPRLGSGGSGSMTSVLVWDHLVW